MVLNWQKSFTWLFVYVQIQYYLQMQSCRSYSNRTLKSYKNSMHREEFTLHYIYSVWLQIK